MKKPIISVRNFRMAFGRTTVIEDLSFDVMPGEVFGFLGSNGSGKTTTIRALLGMYQPTAGELLINGNAFDPSMASFLGYLPEERGLYKKESVVETMVYFGRLKGLSAARAHEWSLKYLERVGLSDKANQAIGSLSGGQQQKIQLGVTIMNDPKLLILDEPTKGFDPINRRLMMEIIEERHAAGAAVILVTHQMEEVERLCDRVMLLKDGKRRLYGTVDEVRAGYTTDSVVLTFSGKLKEDPAFTIHSNGANAAELTLAAGQSAKDIFRILAKQSDLEVRSFAVKQPSLDDIFVEIYAEDRKENHA